MKILVPVKQVADHNVKIRVKPDGSGVDLANVKMSMNPFDDIAVEQAVRLKEAGQATEVVAITVGPPKSADVLRTALAMGADRGIHVLVEDDLAQDIEPLSVAKILALLARDETSQLVLMGKQAIDNDMNATGQILAALLNWGQGTFAESLEVNEGIATVTREVDGGLQVLSLPLPAVVTADLRLAEPRYASLPAIMKAKRKPLETRHATELGLDLHPRLEILAVEEPTERGAGEIVPSVEALVEKLTEKELLA